MSICVWKHTHTKFSHHNNWRTHKCWDNCSNSVLFIWLQKVEGATIWHKYINLHMQNDSMHTQTHTHIEKKTVIMSHESTCRGWKKAQTANNRRREDREQRYHHHCMWRSDFLKLYWPCLLSSPQGPCITDPLSLSQASISPLCLKKIFQKQRLSFWPSVIMFLKLQNVYCTC